MKNINQYKKRFNQLLESTMGNVKPLIMEQSSTNPVEIVNKLINSKQVSGIDELEKLVSFDEWQIVKQKLDSIQKGAGDLFGYGWTLEKTLTNRNKMIPALQFIKQVVEKGYTGKSLPKGGYSTLYGELDNFYNSVYK